MTKYTPMIEQYLGIKATVPDAFLFFRLGDFYEMFLDDAVRASKELEITLTSRDAGTNERIPMCGVPYHSAEGYIAKLIEKGFKVAICEQVEDPAEAKGIVRREIVRIVTPGTLIDGKLLSDKMNNYIACAVQQSGMFGFAVCDISTGELQATQIHADPRMLLDELTVFAPAEMIGNKAMLATISGLQQQLNKPMLLTEWDESNDALMQQQFGHSNDENIPAIAMKAVAKLIAYLNETQKRSLSHIRHIQSYEADQYMTMDAFTRRNLELTETVRERAKKGSLLWLLDEGVTAMGGRLLRRWLEKPLLNKARIEERQEAVDVLYHQLIVREQLREHLKEVYDLERLVARISYGHANGRDLIALRRSLEQIPSIQSLAAGSGSQTLRRIADDIDLCKDICEWITAAIEEDPPATIREGGVIREGYHEYLDQLKDADRNGKQWIAQLEQQERERTGVRTLKVGFNKVFGYYIEVTRAQVAQLKEGDYERKQTLANAERFITPALKEKEALILEAQEKMVGLEQELFIELRDRIARESARLQGLAAMLATLDVYQSLATISATRRYCKPTFHDGYDMNIVQGRHPVVEAVLSDGVFMSNDTRMQESEARMLLITGPNMAGKSTYMRQVAILSIMAQIGCFIPAQTAELPLIDRIFTRIGAADDLIGGQSTFMVEMADIQVMTEHATPQSLVIIDELGRGTSTGEGMAIAQAVIEFLHDQVGCKTLVSTHFHELAHLEESLRFLENHCMAVKESGEQVTFLRKLIRGAASTSYGIYCAQIAGIPQSIIQRSYELLHAEPSMVTAKTGTYEGIAAAMENTRSSASIVAEQQKAQSQQETAASIVQLSLFQEEESRSNQKQAAVKHAALSEEQLKEKAIIEQLSKADLINLTPLAAMNLLFELKQQLSESK